MTESEPQAQRTVAPIDADRNELMATADETTIKRARWEHLRLAACPGTGRVNVCNVSYGVHEKADHTYTVTVEKGQPTDCGCPAAEYQSGPCKHAVAVADHPDVIREAEQDDEREPGADVVGSESPDMGRGPSGIDEL